MHRHRSLSIVYIKLFSYIIYVTFNVYYNYFFKKKHVVYIFYNFLLVQFDTKQT